MAKKLSKKAEKAQDELVDEFILKMIADGTQLPPIGGCKAAYGKTYYELAYGLSEDALIEQGIKRYYRDCRKRGLVPQQPSKTASKVNEDTQLVLANVKGEIVRYDVIAQGTRLRETRKAA